MKTKTYRVIESVTEFHYYLVEAKSEEEARTAVLEGLVDYHDSDTGDDYEITIIEEVQTNE